ncbi:MAG: transglutaminase-like domain-containing protein [Eubacteriales bacterium]|nr:transglutaminase-like domain-containing protein [Eubacteriales bacterium]
MRLIKRKRRGGEASFLPVSRPSLPDNIPAVVLFFFMVCLSLTGCHSKTANPQKKASALPTPAVMIPQADGTKTITTSTLTVDLSNTSKGYIMASYHGEADKVNIQLTGPDGVTYLYFIKESDSYTAMPLSSGSGSYLLDIYEHVEGNTYGTLMSDFIEVNLENEFTPFLYSNQFVYFTEDTRAIQKGAELAKGCESDLEITSNIYNYVIKNTVYDYDKAATVTAPYYPDIDETLATGKGICFDYSALMCAMLRTQGIPCKLNIGYAGKVYHAWISVYLSSTGWVDDMIQFDGSDWSMMDPTLSSADRSFDPSQENYTVMFQR